MKKTLCFILSLIMVLCLLPAGVFAADEGAPLRILFTHDIHSYLEPSKAYVDGVLRERGGVARLSTLLKKFSNDHSIYFDGGDFSQGTLFQAGFEDFGCELRMLGELGCAATTFGNHEFDHAGKGAATMLTRARTFAENEGKTLPVFMTPNIDWSEDPASASSDEKALASALKAMGSSNTAYFEVNGIKIGVFSLMGIDGISCSPTAGVEWVNYIDFAKNMVAQLRPNCDFLVCLSHTGTDGNGESGEDIDLAEAVPGIDFILSGHTHTAYKELIQNGNTYIGSCGEYLDYLGVADFMVYSDHIEAVDYQLVPVDESVAGDPYIEDILAGYKYNINKDYLAKFGDYTYSQVIAHCNFDFEPLSEMYATHDEYPLGDLIADSYLYEARKNGINDIDVALVGLGTIRGSFFEGDITVSDAFEICSLGAGEDGSAGHPLLYAYITGRELKLLLQLDSSLGPMVSSIKMSYAGLRYSFNNKRLILDKVTEAYLVNEDGSREEIEDGKLYKVCCNMYAANMLGMLNGLTKGILSITPKYQDGSVVEEFYDVSLKDINGQPIKEWVAFADYLQSFEVGKSGYPEIPANYEQKDGRKYKYEQGGLAIFDNPGPVTCIVIFIGCIFLFAVVMILRKVRAKKIAKDNVRL